MTCNAIYWQKARIKSKTLVAQTVSQPAVYAKGLAYNLRPSIGIVMGVLVFYFY
jgi:hypothetical protein